MNKVLCLFLFLGLLALCTFFLWPVYRPLIEEDLRSKALSIYQNQVHDVPPLKVKGLQLEIPETELSPSRYRRFQQITGLYVPPPPSAAVLRTHLEEQKRLAVAKALQARAEAAADNEPSELTPDEPVTVSATPGMTFTRAGETIWLRGLLPGPNYADQLRQLIQTKAPQARFIDETLVTRREMSPWWKGLSLTLLEEILTSAHGHAYLGFQKEKSSIVARTERQDALTRLEGLVAQIPREVSSDPNLSLQVKPKLASLPLPVPKEQATESSQSKDLASAFRKMTVRFASGSSSLNRSHKETLESLAAVLRAEARPSQVFLIASYAAGTGSQARKLGLQRTEVVRNQLISYGVSPNQLLTGHFKLPKGERRRLELRPATSDEVIQENQRREKLAAADREEEEKPQALSPEAVEAPAVPVDQPEEKPVKAPPSTPPASPFDDLAITFGGGGSAWLHPKFDKKFKAIAQLIQEDPEAEAIFAVASYGTENPELSRLRAEAVFQKLLEEGVPPNRLLTVHLDRTPGTKRRVQVIPATPEQIEAERNITQQEEKERLGEEEEADALETNAPTSSEAVKGSTSESGSAAPPITTLTPSEEDPEPEPEPEVAPPAPIDPPASPFSSLTITFAGQGSSWLHPKFDRTFDQIAQLMKSDEMSAKKFTVVSYGSGNPELARLRAEAVRASLLKRGIRGTRLQTDGRPIGPNSRRRVEIIFAAAPPSPSDSSLPAEPTSQP